MMSPHRISVVALLVLATGYVAVHYYRQRASERRLIAASRVSVVMVRSTFPPALVVEFENAGQARIGRTHFRLSFEVNGREISRADEDVLNMLPNEMARPGGLEGFWTLDSTEIRVEIRRAA